MIPAFEGAPGVGKSTVASVLRDGGLTVIPEVNRLFRRPSRSSQPWYLDRQVARCEMAALASDEGALSILDGDPLQPVWFGWIYPGEGWVDPATALELFSRYARQDALRLPDRYFLSTLDEEDRAARMLARECGLGSDEQRARAKVARYAAMVEPQMRLFGALGEAFPGWVERIEPTAEPAHVAAAVLAMPSQSAPPAVEALAFIQRWFEN
jgi:hypothetical protein